MFNKKAFTLHEAVKLGVVASLVLFTVIFAYRVSQAFAGERDDGSIANFDRLVKKMQELANSNKKMAHAEISYSLGAERTIAGYNKVWDSEKNLDILRLKVEKPSICGGSACLCLFKENSVLSGKPRNCAKFEKVEFFLRDKTMAPASGDNTIAGTSFYSQLPENFANDEYKYLILSGAYFGGKNQAIYIEKYTNPNGQIVFYFAPVNDATKDKINARKSYIDAINKKQ